LLVARGLLPVLGLYTPAALFASRSIRALLLATFFWAMALAVDVAGQSFASSHWGEGQPAKRALFTFGSRVGKFFVACLVRVETFAERDRIRWAFTFGVTYQTSEAQLRSILAETEQLLRKHPKVWPVDASVRFKEFGESGLVLDVAAWFDLRDFDAFTLIRQDLLLAFMGVVERTGAKFALPTRTLTVAIEDTKRQAPQGSPPTAESR
jgi:MscS family membrane protein